MKKHSRPGSRTRHDFNRSRHSHSHSSSAGNNSSNINNSGMNSNGENDKYDGSSSVVEHGSPEQGFSSQQQKAIIEHLLITKNSAPKKDYSHVPCKFFVQGNCQAGDSCPFSHDLNSAVSEQTCKYFQKGNCKFGMKCANAHVLPNGTRLNPRRSSLPNAANSNSSSNPNSNPNSNSNGISNSISNKHHNSGNIVAGSARAEHMSGPGLAPALPAYRTTFTTISKQQQQQQQFSTPITNSSSSFMWTSEQTSPINYSNLVSNEVMQNSEFIGNNTYAMEGPNTPQMFTYSYEAPSSAQSNTYAYPTRYSEYTSPNSHYGPTELQLEETLLPNELSDLLTPNENRRRESFNKASTMTTKPLSAPNSFSSSSASEPRLSYSSSSSSSDFAWRNLTSSNQNIEYWQNLEQLENNLNRFKIEEQDEDKLNANTYHLSHESASPHQANMVPNSQGFPAHARSNASGDTQFMFDDLHGGIY